MEYATERAGQFQKRFGLMFFKKRKKKVAAITAIKAAGIVSLSISGYMSNAKPVLEIIMQGKDKDKQDCVVGCNLAFQVGYLIESGGRIASGGAEEMLTSEQADFGAQVAREIFEVEHGNGDRTLEIAFHFSVTGHEAAYQIGRREGQRFIRKEGSSLDEPDQNTLYDLFTCIENGTYDSITLS